MQKGFESKNERIIKEQEEQQQEESRKYKTQIKPNPILETTLAKNANKRFRFIISALRTEDFSKTRTFRVVSEERHGL
ncbi:hypothetical protein TcasGA2_TC006156 [Tribolium castaneum]|uniref:Uncharacterized protein n=1 Tax=Tribolium castaneum TaxID=7070 RepID=D6WUX5_TRICA|nr:hypothetical protein TcasGA2_TC006156 [Tribolium castaneum]